MGMNDVDELVMFLDVTVLSATASSLLCRVGGKNVWLPRVHVAGKLWATGDRGKLFIRRWVASDRHLIDAAGVPVTSSPRLAAPLHRLTGARKAHQAK
jgi:hypothetical protein